MIKTFFSVTFLLAAYTLPAQGKFYGGSGDGFATATITNNVLPVRVLQFSATAANGGVNGWLQLSGVQQVCAVQLERSANGFVFVPAAVQAVTAGSPPGFQLRDDAAPAGTVYYRAAITRCDGSVLYTAVVTVKGGGAVSLYTSGRQLYYRQAPAGAVLQLYNLTGQPVFTQRLTGGSGFVILPAVPAGVYLVRLNDVAMQQVALE